MESGMDRMELGWLMFQELDQAEFEAWLGRQPDAEAIGREIGGVYLPGKARTEKARKQVVASVEGGVVRLQEYAAKRQTR